MATSTDIEQIKEFLLWSRQENLTLKMMRVGDVTIEFGPVDPSQDSEAVPDEIAEDDAPPPPRPKDYYQHFAQQRIEKEG